MNGTEVAEVLVVRAVEEWDAEAVLPEERIGALEAAGPFDETRGWFARRAAWLLDHGLAGYRGVGHLTEALSLRAAPVLVASFAVGLLTNQLGPGGRIHALYNPIAVLIAWNLAVLAASLLPWPRPPRLPARPSAADVAGRLSRAERPEPPEPRVGLLTRWILYRLWPGVFLRLARGALDAGERARGFSAVARRFWRLWITRARPALVTQLRRALHLGAVGVVAGAVAGMLVRGLFLEYRVVWRSTFLHDPDTIAAGLRVLLGPAALLAGQPLPSAAETAAMLEPEGVGAARWIGLYALSAALFVAVPRALLAWRSGWRLARIGREVDLDLGDAYFERIRAEARAVHVGRVTEQIESDVRAESRRFAADLAEWVCAHLYDARIAPRVAEFRGRGGNLAELEQRFREECEGFAPELEAHLPEARARFERQLAEAVEATVGVRAGIATDPAGALARKLGSTPDAAAQALSRSLGNQLADVVGAAVSAATAGVAGTVSGGFGKALGTAILVKLLGTTGPVGFGIGALGGAGVAVSAWWLGRERVADRMKGVSMPGWLTRVALSGRRSRRMLREGRRRCAAEVDALVTGELEPLTPQIAEQIWTRVKPLLGELHRSPSEPEGSLG